MTNDTAGFKVGDRVQATSRATYVPAGWQGTVAAVDESSAVPYYVTWDHGVNKWQHPYAIERTPTPAPLPELTINGHRYVLAPEAVAQVPEVKRGQVWRNINNAYLLIVREMGSEKLAALILTGWFNQYGLAPTIEDPTRWADNNMTYIAPTLADALASGLLTAEMLRGES